MFLNSKNKDKEKDIEDYIKDLIENIDNNNNDFEYMLIKKCKLEIGICKGKKLYDKREDEKEKCRYMYCYNFKKLI